MERDMKRSFVLFGMLIVCVGLFAEGIPKNPHLCRDYKNASDQIWNTEFISDWFDHLEEADDNSGYSKDFLQEHGGRVGTLVVEKVEDGCVWYGDKCYITRCSGTLIGENYFLTAGHCAINDGKNVGVLFGYQVADLEDNNITHPEYPRVSLKRYLDETGNYRQYGGGVGKPANFTEHPAYFPIIDDENSGNYGPVEHGWNNVYWVDENGKPEIRKA